MNKARILSLLALLGCTLFVCNCEKQDPAPSKEPSPASTPAEEVTEVKAKGDKIQLGIYYAGHPGSDREKDFVGFLNKHFTKVQSGDLAAFTGSQSEGFDVTILDYDGDGFESPKPQIRSGFSEPVMTMGVTGAFICGNLNLKTDYL